MHSPGASGPTAAPLLVFFCTINYYDDRQRLIQAIAENHKGGKDTITTLYDFAGKVLETSLSHQVGSATTEISTRRTYDQNSRPINTYHSTGGATEVLLYANAYNSVGQLKTKNLHGQGGQFAQELDYEYNTRGWLMKINQPDVSGIAGGDNVIDYFGMEVGYQSQLSGLTTDELYNGNISSMKWSVLGKTDQAYVFDYDPMNRLLNATHFDKATGTWDDNDGRFTEGSLTYDLNGNIKTLIRKDSAGASMDNLAYTYFNGNASNRLKYVGDNGDDLKGFADGNSGTDDYAYDVNGNMSQDKNKGIAAGNIRYNFLNLPRSVRKSGADSLVYVYDATGRKLKQQVFGSTAKTTDYLGDFIYENDTLRFINHEEGRVLPDGSGWEYQYHMKDHLGNVRLTFSGKVEIEDKAATLEDASMSDEVANFLRYEHARRIYSIHFDRTNGSSPGYAQRLNGSANEKYGLARSLSVMPGDTIRAEVYGKYVDANTSNWTGALATLMNQILTNNAAVVFEGGSYGGSTAAFPYSTLSQTSGSTGGPKAYLNWLIFDRDMHFIEGGYSRMSSAPKEYGQQVAHERLFSPDIIIDQPGYVYIYLSNEEETTAPVEVYFDDMKVEHVKRGIVQMDDYYPFGLTFSSHLKESSIVNRRRFQGQEHVDDLVLGWDSFRWRNHQPDIGRFFGIDPLSEKYYYNSPFAFSENKVTAHIELEGLESVHYTVRPVVSGAYERNFDPRRSYDKTGAITVSVDLGKGVITDTNCGGMGKGSQSPTLTKNDDGSLSVRGVGNFQNEGLAAFNITTTNNLGKDGTLNVKSTIVTDNKAPYEVIMAGTVDGKKEDGGFLLNAVSQTLAPIPRGINSAPETAEDQTSTDVQVYTPQKPGDAQIGFVKKAGAGEFKTSTTSDVEKAKKQTIIRP